MGLPVGGWKNIVGSGDKECPECNHSSITSTFTLKDKTPLARVHH